MWCSYDQSNARSAFDRMSAADRFEAQRLADRIREIHDRELSVKSDLTAAIKKYSHPGPTDQAVRSWADIAVIAGVVISSKPELRKYAMKKALEKGKEKAEETFVKTAVDDKEAGELIWNVIDILSSDTPIGAGIKAFDPFQSLSGGDDLPNEVQYQKDKLSELEQEYATCFLLLSTIINTYDNNIICDTARIQGAQLRAR